MFDKKSVFLSCHPYEKTNYLFSDNCERTFFVDYEPDSIHIFKVINACVQTPLDNLDKLELYQSFLRSIP